MPHEEKQTTKLFYFLENMFLFFSYRYYESSLNVFFERLGNMRTVDRACLCYVRLTSCSFMSDTQIRVESTARTEMAYFPCRLHLFFILLYFSEVGPECTNNTSSRFAEEKTGGVTQPDDQTGYKTEVSKMYLEKGKICSKYVQFIDQL